MKEDMTIELVDKEGGSRGEEGGEEKKGRSG